MSLFDNVGIRLAALALVLGIAPVLASCQVRPLYASSGPLAEMASVAIKPATNRVEQVIRNDLIFALSGGAGEPASPVYELSVRTTSSTSHLFLDQRSTSAPKPGDYQLTASYALTRDGEPVKTGKVSSLVMIDVSGQEYAKIRATRSAEDRAAHDIAEQIRTQIAIALSR